MESGSSTIVFQSAGDLKPIVDGAPSQAILRAIACLEDGSINEKVSPDEINDFIANKDNLVWLDVQDPGESEVDLLLEQFGFHPLSVEDVYHPGQRSKVDEYKGYLFVVTYTVRSHEGYRDVELCEVDMYVGQNFLVTLHRGKVPALEEAHGRWMNSGDMIQDGVGFLVYTVLDALVDDYFPVLDAIEEHMEEYEIDVFTRVGNQQVPHLLRLKRVLMGLRRAVAPLREVFNAFQRREVELFSPQTRVYLHDVYDHVLRILDAIEMEREMLSGAVEANLTVLSNRLNETMKTLTVVTIVVAIMGSMFGAWGMNFEYIPFADYRFGFWVMFVGTMATVGGTLYWAWRQHRP